MEKTAEKSLVKQLYSALDHLHAHSLFHSNLKVSVLGIDISTVRNILTNRFTRSPA